MSHGSHNFIYFILFYLYIVSPAGVRSILFFACEAGTQSEVCVCCFSDSQFYGFLNLRARKLGSDIADTL